MCQNHALRRADDRHHGGRLILLVLALILLATMLAIPTLKERQALAACADNDQQYRELVSALEECDRTAGCMITASEIRSLRRARAAAATQCATNL